MAQALLLTLLTDAATHPLTWPATQPVLFLPLLLLAVFAPIVAITGAGQMPGRAVAIWTAAAALLVMALGYHEVARNGVTAAHFDALWQSALLPRFSFWLAVCPALFVAHVLVVDSVGERRLRPSYSLHFDNAWKLGLQGAVSAVFVAVFWGILELGAALFTLVDITGPSRLLRHDWFYFPATTIALALALHVTDVQPALLRSVRAIVLTLFSWLLPLLVLILAAFLSSLPFISLRPLWNTHFAALLLLTSAGILVFLINTCYQDGGAEQPVEPIKRGAGVLGAIALVPLAGLAIWALSLRVAEHGWSVQRINAACVAGVIALYALGYAAAVIRRRPWLKGIEATNFACAIASVALVLFLYSAAGDPARLMVANQVAALKSGTVPVAKFDFDALGRQGARWGMEALSAMAAEHGSADAAVATQARLALDRTRNLAGPFDALPLDAEQITVFPKGRQLPADFIGKLSNESRLQLCMQQKCTARYVTLHSGGVESLIITSRFFSAVFDLSSSGN